MAPRPALDHGGFFEKTATVSFKGPNQDSRLIVQREIDRRSRIQREHVRSVAGGTGSF